MSGSGKSTLKVIEYLELHATRVKWVVALGFSLKQSSTDLIRAH